METRLLELEQRMATQSSQMEEMLKLLQERDKEKEDSTESNVSNGGKSLGFVPKIEFPVFGGANPRIWIKKCMKYFSLCKILDNQKVDLASLYLVGKAESWFNSYIAVRRSVEWEDLVVDLCARFKEEIGGNVVEEFNKLNQTGTIDDYLDAFENLKGLMLQRNPLLPEQYFLDSFIGGLKPNLKPFVKAFKPTSLNAAVEYARLQHESIQTTRFQPKSNFQPQKPLNLPNPTYNKSALLPTPSVPNPHNHSSTRNYRPTRYLTPAERAEKQAKGLCEEEEEELMDLSNTVEDELEMFQKDPNISVSALFGNTAYNTMRVTGYIGKKPLHILIDSGSTHNFLDVSLAMKLGCKIDSMPSQSVSVADGNTLSCKSMCKGFQWRLQNTTFQTDALLIPLGGCDMVLGVQWLQSLGTVKWNFQQLRMEFTYNGALHVLRGIHPKAPATVSGASMTKLMQTGVSSIHLCFLKLGNNDDTSLISCLAHEVEVKPPELELLLTKYQPLFDEPKALPPSRPLFDHKIPLMPNVQPVNIRPYRYPIKQKDIIENTIQEMLDNGIIQDSSSPFASPVILVGKKDGTWRLCVDYRELNNKTVRDKFPIPVVEELIDELAGAVVFTKLDLRSGYHQLRMHADDVHKTAFKTHSGHFEFLVMPFGLTNAPASFQSWMNHVFKPLLRKCVLVFFDDILVYSSSMDLHWKHLEAVFQLMTHHHLFAKPSKCAFAVPKVEYLGHFISAAGVSTDPSKIDAIQKWPTPTTVKELRSFLGLSGYYRKFVRNYAVISKPLTQLLKKGSFYGQKMLS
ncbi:uncharacterized protein LOC125498867 [Beta vulgaris subsp. vulgaris]|uniref:uncharacterized protein LOC125498867 n=1 Tax=Beta vulgaris subsp. vulgaris TaxID=3555 RepID=UPI002036C139|nr:uncharacterized protein LOC125498867 [Beta vulgaris subsp. vulgaris]